MGDYADDYIDSSLNYALDYKDFVIPTYYRNYTDNERQNLKWKTKDNGMIKVKDMTKNHIENCLRFLIKSPWEKIFEDELKYRKKQQT